MTVDIEKLEELAKAWRIHVAQQEISDDILNLIADFKSTAHDHDLLRAECEALRKDADRYRFLRDANDDLIAACSIGEDSITFLGDIDLDQHIDAAMIDGANQ